MKKYRIAVVGATGLVGGEMLKALDTFDIPIEHLYLFASEKSAGKEVFFRNQTYVVEALNPSSFDYPIDYALFSAGGKISEIYAPIAKSKKITVIDNSSFWRMNKDVPLIVPEVNMDAIKQGDYIIANPNCSTIQSVLPLKAISQAYDIERVSYVTYQAVSGSGIRGIEDLKQGIEGKPNTFYVKPIAYNVIPQIDMMLEDGYTKEEQKMIDETRKILNLPNLKVTATCVRVPVLNGHSVAIQLTLKQPFEIADIKRLLLQFPGIQVFDDHNLPTPKDASGQDDVYVGRIRKDDSTTYGCHLWVVADNIRKGAASNAVQILKKLLEVKV